MQQNATHSLTKQDYRQKWMEGLDHEIGFWQHWIHSQGQGFGEDFKVRLDPQTPLQDHIHPLLDHLPAGSLRLLDVGAGPLTALGKIYRSQALDIIAVDPLADYYDQILRKAQLNPPVRTTWCHGELLEERFQPSSFDLVFSQNALDHSYDPYAIIKSMIRLTKVGHYVLLEHRQNEAEHEQYQGLHQWNFAMEQGDLVIWNPSAQLNVSQSLAQYVDIQIHYIADVDWLNIQMKKLKDLPSAAVMDQDDLSMNQGDQSLPNELVHREAEITRLTSELSGVQAELDTVYRSRSYRAIKKYWYFMDHSTVGKIIKKLKGSRPESETQETHGF